MASTLVGLSGGSATSSSHNLLILQHKWKVLSTKSKSRRKFVCRLNSILILFIQQIAAIERIYLTTLSHGYPTPPYHHSHQQSQLPSPVFEGVFDFKITFYCVCVCVGVSPDVMYDVWRCASVNSCRERERERDSFKQRPSRTILNFNRCSCRKSRKTKGNCRKNQHTDGRRQSWRQSNKIQRKRKWKLASTETTTKMRKGMEWNGNPQVRVKENKTLCKCATLAVKWNSPWPNYTWCLMSWLAIAVNWNKGDSRIPVLPLILLMPFPQLVKFSTIV